MKNFVLITLILFILSCSLDRTNPLDPLVNGEDFPDKVPNIQVVSIGNNTIMINWDPLINIDGYYIYRSQSYDGFFELIKDEGDISVTSYEDQPGNYSTSYWYKMSAYLLINGEKLEGYRSEAKTWGL